MKPSLKPQITRDRIERIIIDYAPPERAVLVGVRGYYLNTMGAKGRNDRGIYDDAIILVSPYVFEAFNANTDPSIQRKGIATLRPGLHYFRKGKHGLSRPGGGYPALRPATPGEQLPVDRDGIADPRPGVAINIHRGSRNSTSSEGCQTIYPDQWPFFIEMVYGEMDRFKQRRIPYILVENTGGLLA